MYLCVFSTPGCRLNERSKLRIRKNQVGIGIMLFSCTPKSINNGESFICCE